MAYRKLSEQIEKLTNPQRSDTFVKAFRDAVREGDIDAAFLPERFTLPKQFSVRGSDEVRTKDVKDMLFEVTPDFDEWFENINRELSTGRRGARVKPTADNITAGLVDFKALAEETRKKMEASFSKGQTLGKSRAKGDKKPGRPRKK
ncbi:hypothetical protein [Deinococcus maricopensis]|uniref:Uncharacterized protein n=1 Tax=Deinococcus maricopensis (strain DSM 21211 / LMG 22137 / NRRL B-23946 / LB-34) TaxID=709986 RepID=E8U4Q4_DEIML|nr:hypothetical protein [Deinococcus maricopensis]ADV68919.1 hypothetical protein Deima_3292 [Deinococcus maricopensis DSM 21211]